MSFSPQTPTGARLNRERQYANKLSGGVRKKWGKTVQFGEMFSRLLSGFSNCTGRDKIHMAFIRRQWNLQGTWGRKKESGWKHPIITYSLRNRLQYSKRSSSGKGSYGDLLGQDSVRSGTTWLQLDGIWIICQGESRYSTHGHIERWNSQFDNE